jgi:LacI family transcriptional regulator
VPHAARPTVTLRDVAAAAGVSVATASRVLNGSARTVAPAYEDRVRAAAAALRYTTDAAARAMRRAGDSIALIADDLTTPSIAMVVAAMEREARSVGAFVTVSATRGVPRRQLETVRALRALRPRAIVLTSSGPSSPAGGASGIAAGALDGRLRDELLGYQAAGGRVVVVGDTDMPFDAIRFDNEGTAREVGAYVASSGHRRIVILAGDRGRSTFAARAAGFVAGLRDNGVPARGIRMVACEVSRDGGYAAVRRLLARARSGGLDAVVAANDVLAIGALSALRAAGVPVPGLVSVTGFDDIPLARDVTPRLTTAALPLAGVGADAIRLALDPAATARGLVVRGRLVVRDSLLAR